MIAFLNGLFAHKTPSAVIIDVHGVGYEVHISLNTFIDIQHLETGLLYTYYHLREDALTLYGFSREDEKNLFISLISVSGVGAATARVMLSSMRPDEIVRAIMTNNTRQLESIKGIGKKSAERIILELKDKVGKINAIMSQNNSTFKSNTLEQDALNALISLGITRSAAELAVQRVMTAEPGIQVEDIIKKALKTL